ncbi:MAG: 3,4-dihydroxy-2-butanone-4-phosphate synthase [Gammaproteobacteria bacterium]|nr:3,4-dihydroxy-2-butanone-4-phosphate synthase [Gammaproteobacteria bacterium]
MSADLAGSGFDRIEDILADLAAGKMVVIMDDEHRENEGDLLMAAAKVRPEDINFMARHGRGLICLTLTEERCRQLRLPLMVSDTHREHRTNFTLSIEAAEGVTTGISAHDRAHTVRTAVAAEAMPQDLRQPGHIFPIMAQRGGVLTRAGHTEAGCDLARLAGLEPAAVIVEIMNDDGTMARRPELEKFARAHGLRIGTIADLIRYRLRTERSIERIADRRVQIEAGEFRLLAYQDHVHRDVHLALVRGELTAGDAPLVRVHLTDTLRDVVGVRAGARRWTLRAALERIAAEGQGVVIVLRESESPRELADAVTALDGSKTSGSAAEGAPVLRTYGIGAQILKDLGVRRMRVLSAPKQMHGLSAFDLEVVSYVDSPQ